MIVVEGVPAVTAEEMRQVDRAVVEDLHIELIQMENAGRGLAELGLRLFDPRSAVVLAGTGGNGAARSSPPAHLANWGVDVHVVLSHREPAMAPVPAHQLDTVRRMRLPVRPDPTRRRAIPTARSPS